MMNVVRRFGRDEAGTTAIEYGLIATFIALAVISSIQLLGTTLITDFYDVVLAAFN
ncbi:MAG: Flp family type IVb pilin [Alphaproteobacteria bacterium]|nr:Flp family type IVb pilin [Alphaproteobacteria bacterium]